MLVHLSSSRPLRSRVFAMGMGMFVFAALGAALLSPSAARAACVGTPNNTVEGSEQCDTEAGLVCPVAGQNGAQCKPDCTLDISKCKASTAPADPGTSGGIAPPVPISNVPVFGSFAEFWKAISAFARTMSLYVALLFVVIAGYYYIIARGDEKDYTAAKQSLLGISIGLALIGFSEAAVSAVASLRDGGDAAAFHDKAVFVYKTLLAPIVEFLIPFALAWAVLMVVIAGFRLITANGDEKEMEKAKKTFTYAAMGLLVIGLAKSALAIFAGAGGLDAPGDLLDITKDPIAAANLFKTVLSDNFTAFIIGLALPVSVLMLLVAGFRLVVSQGNEDAMKSARRTMAYAVTGLLIIGLAASAIALFANKSGPGLIDITKDPNGGANTFITGFINPFLKFIVSFVGAVAVFMFVKAGYDYITAAGDSKRVETAKNEVTFGIVGLLVIGLAESVVHGIFVQQGRFLVIKTQDAIQVIFTIINFALSFLGSISLLFIVYAGFLYLTDGGEGSNKKKALDIIRYTIVGILVIIFSYAIVNIFVTGGRGIA